MKKKTFGKVIACVMAVMMVLSTGIMSAFATEGPAVNYKNSVGSVVADRDADDVSENAYGSAVTGKDETQQKESEYTNVTYDGTDKTVECNVYATVAEGSDVYNPEDPSNPIDGKIVVGVPTVLILSGTPNANGEYVGSGKIAVKGNISGTTVINVTAPASVTLSQTNKADITASIAQDFTKFVVEGNPIAGQTGVNNHVTPAFNADATGVVTITAKDGVSAGSWHGVFNWTISTTSVTA